MGYDIRTKNVYADAITINPNGSDNPGFKIIFHADLRIFNKL